MLITIDHSFFVRLVSEAASGLLTAPLSIQSSGHLYFICTVIFYFHRNVFAGRVYGSAASGGAASRAAPYVRRSGRVFDALSVRRSRLFLVAAARRSPFISPARLRGRRSGALRLRLAAPAAAAPAAALPPAARRQQRTRTAGAAAAAGDLILRADARPDAVLSGRRANAAHRAGHCVRIRSQ